MQCASIFYQIIRLYASNGLDQGSPISVHRPWVRVHQNVKGKTFVYKRSKNCVKFESTSLTSVSDLILHKSDRLVAFVKNYSEC